MQKKAKIAVSTRKALLLLPVLFLLVQKVVAADVYFADFVNNHSLLLQIKARSVDNNSNAKDTSCASAYPGDIVQVRISNPMTLLYNRPTDFSRLVLYVNGIPLEGIYSDWFSQLSNEYIHHSTSLQLDSTVWIRFLLQRDLKSKNAWDYLYRNTAHWYDTHINVNVSIGWQGMYPISVQNTKVSQLRIVYFGKWTFIIWLCVFIAFIGLFAYLGVTTNLLHENGKDSAYSLSLTQLLFWTTLVIGAFIYTLLLTDMTASFNTSILLLLGISVSTTGIASFISIKFGAKASLPLKGNRNFLCDVLTDGESYSVQRVQIFAWNLILGIYFVGYTINNKTMPEFSETMLLLMGISSASYLGNKIPEQKEQLKRNELRTQKT